jgi:hypothetical protein
VTSDETYPRIRAISWISAATMAHQFVVTLGQRSHL